MVLCPRGFLSCDKRSIPTGMFRVVGADRGEAAETRSGKLHLSAHLRLLVLKDY